MPYTEKRKPRPELLSTDSLRKFFFFLFILSAAGGYIGSAKSGEVEFTDAFNPNKITAADGSHYLGMKEFFPNVIQTPGMLAHKDSVYWKNIEKESSAGSLKLAQALMSGKYPEYAQFSSESPYILDAIASLAKLSQAIDQNIANRKADQVLTGENSLEDAYQQITELNKIVKSIQDRLDVLDNDKSFWWDENTPGWDTRDPQLLDLITQFKTQYKKVTGTIDEAGADFKEAEKLQQLLAGVSDVLFKVSALFFGLTGYTILKPGYTKKKNSQRRTERNSFGVHKSAITVTDVERAGIESPGNLIADVDELDRNDENLISRSSAKE